MAGKKPALKRQQKKPGIPPGLILLIIAVIIFGLMFAFNYIENQNPDWLRPTG